MSDTLQEALIKSKAWSSHIGYSVPFAVADGQDYTPPKQPTATELLGVASCDFVDRMS